MLKSKLMSFWSVGVTIKVQLTFKFYSNFQLKKKKILSELELEYIISTEL